ncbi:hypothetical protein [Candidatus Poriferisodalis sp.]
MRPIGLGRPAPAGATVNLTVEIAVSVQNLHFFDLGDHTAIWD